MLKQNLIGAIIALVLVIAYFGGTSYYNNQVLPYKEKVVIVYDENKNVLLEEIMTIAELLDYTDSKTYIDTFGYNKEERYKSLEQSISQLQSLDSVIIRPIYWHRDLFGGSRSFTSSATSTWRKGKKYVSLFLSVDNAKFDGKDEIEVSMSPRQSYGYSGSSRVYLNESIMEVVQNQLISSKDRLIESKITVSIQGNIPSMNSEYTISEDESPENIALSDGIKKLAKEKSEK